MSYNPFSLTGKIILITGASSGIGRATAVECARLGAQLIISGRNSDRLNETFISLKGSGHSQFVADLSEMEQLEAFCMAIPSIDGLVHCAGIQKTMLVQHIKPEEMQSIFNVNLFAPTYLTSLLLKNRRINKGASVVMLSSIDGPITSHVGNSIYSASKAAITSMAKTMALEFSPRQIRVNCVLPGMTETPMINIDEITEEQINADKTKYPLKRYGKPEEIARAVVYFLSDASSWTTGSTLVVDGGYSLL